MKTAWIFPGGSARAVYTAGVVSALSDMKIPKPDVIIGASGSAGTCLYYVAEQKEYIEKAWCSSLSTKKFLSFWRFWRVLNINYLVDTVMKKDNPLDLDKISKSAILLYIPVTDSKTGKVEYFSNKMGLDVYELMRATVHVPIWANLFSVRGNQIKNGFYCDSPPSSRFQLHVQKALDVGAKRIIVFDSWHPHDNPTGFLFTKLFTYLKNKDYMKRQLSYFKEIENFSPPINVEYLYVCPTEKLAMTRFEIDNDYARKIFKRGYSDTLKNEKLQTFMPLQS